MTCLGEGRLTHEKKEITFEPGANLLFRPTTLKTLDGMQFVLFLWLSVDGHKRSIGRRELHRA